MGTIFSKSLTPSKPFTPSTPSKPSTPPLHTFQGGINDYGGKVTITLDLRPNGFRFKVVYPNPSDNIDQSNIESLVVEVAKRINCVVSEVEDPYTLHSTALTVHVTCKGGDGYSRTITMECYHGDTCDCDCDFNFDIAALAKQASALGYECEYNPVSNISQMRGSLEHGSLSLSLPSTAPPLMKVGGNSAACTAACTA